MERRLPFTLPPWISNRVNCSWIVPSNKDKGLSLARFAWTVIHHPTTISRWNVQETETLIEYIYSKVGKRQQRHTDHDCR